VRVLLLGSYPPPYGGLQVHIVALRRFLLERSVACSVINLDRHRDGGEDGVYYPRSALGVLWLLLRLPYDVVHLHVGGDLTTRHLVLGLVCSWLPGKKSVLTLHSGGYPSSPAGQATSRKSIRGFVLRRFDRVVGVNDEIVDLFQRAGVPSTRAHLIEPHALFQHDIDDLLLTDRDSALGERLSPFFDAHDPVLLTVGLLEREYNLALQVEALAALRETHHRAGLAIIGSGSLESELRALIAEKPYAEHILLCGDVEHRATLRAIADCDLLLRPTSYDGDAISVREALHFGTPVLASDNGMRPAGVRLIEGLEPGTFATAIASTLSSSREFQPARCDDSNIARVVDVYDSLASRSERTGQ